MSDPCLFCGARPAGSPEHVIPKWVSRLLWKVSPLTPEHGEFPRRGPDGRRQRIRKIIDIVTTAVCGSCNNTWTSALENTSKTFVAATIAGALIQIDSTAAAAMARWCWMKALLAEAGCREDGGEASAGWPAGLLREMGEFYWRRRPSIGSGVWIGRYDLADAWPELVGRVDSCELHYRRRGVDYTGWQMLFTLGHLLVITNRWDAQAPDWFDLCRAPAPPGSIVRIWPVHSGSTDWPPPALSYEQLGRLATWTG